MSNAGTKSSGFAWLVALATAAVAVGVAFLGLKVAIPGFVSWLVYIGAFGVGGAVAVYRSKAGAGGGIAAYLVAALLTAVGLAIVAGMAVSEATTAMASVGAADKSAEAAAHAAGNAVGMFAGILVAIGGFVVTFLAGMTGVLIGNSMKKKALAGGAAQRLAA